jgi:hypothetical protein
MLCRRKAEVHGVDTASDDFSLVPLLRPSSASRVVGLRRRVHVTGHVYWVCVCAAAVVRRSGQRFFELVALFITTSSNT